MKQGLNYLQDFIQENKEIIIVLADKHTLQDCYPLLGVDVPHFIVPYGEGYKNLNSCEFIWKKLIDLNANRKSILLCLGGGVLCDMGAFAGACFQRGVRVVLAPTSLLAMVDASAGGKTGVNFMGLKNYVGLFHKSEETFICPEFLETLPHKEMINGYVEMLKHGLIADKDHYNKVKYYFLKDSQKIDAQLIYDSIAIKERHVQEDFRDEGIRQRLNFGHTIGHAIESYSLRINEENKSLPHGVSVALGMVAESYISAKQLGLPQEELQEISIVLQRLIGGVEEAIPSTDVLLPFLYKDKKNNSESVNFALLESIGKSKHNMAVSTELIDDGLNYLRSLK